MQVAELFVNLGVKGADKTVGALAGINKGLGEAKSTAFETKAAIVGLLYAFEQLFAASNKRGTDLKNFETITGVSAVTLQKYQRAGDVVGATNEEIAGSLETLQDSATKVWMGLSAPPEGMARISQLVGDINNESMELFSKDPTKYLQKLQEYAQKEIKDRGVSAAKTTLRTVPGMTDNVISGLVQNVFVKRNFDKAKPYTEDEVGKLNEIRQGWTELGRTFQKMVGDFNIKNGKEIISGLNEIIPKVAELANAFLDLNKQIGTFSYLTTMIQGMSNALSALILAIRDPEEFFKTVDELNNAGSSKTNPKIKDPNYNPMNNPALNGVPKSGVIDAAGNFMDEDTKRGREREKELINGVVRLILGGRKLKGVGTGGDIGGSPIDAGNAAKPKVVPKIEGGNNSSSVEINQNLNFQHPGTNAQETANSVKSAVQQYYRQSAAQTQMS